MSKTSPKRFFIELDICDGATEMFERGFYYARKYPKHQSIVIAESEEFELMMLYTGDEPTSTDILKMLEADSNYAEYLEYYREQLNDELNDVVVEMIEEDHG